MACRPLVLLAIGATAGCGSRPVEEYPPPASPAGVEASPARMSAPARVGTEGSTVVLDRRARELILRDRSGRELERRAAGTGPANVVGDERGFAYVTDTEGEGLLLFQTTPHLALRRRMALRGSPYAIALDAGRNRLWITLSATGEVAEVRAGSLPGILRRFETVPAPVEVDVAQGEGRVTVRGARGETRRFVPPVED